MNNLISIITPFYQAEKYLESAIKSVLKQSYKNWELLLINDGSTDYSKTIALNIKDPRIRYLEQENRGVSAARNLGLMEMTGDYFCFLDADDVLPSASLGSRLSIFQGRPDIAFVDGSVKKMDAAMSTLLNIWRPSFKGAPLSDLIQLTGKSFFGLSWMIKRKVGIEYHLDEGMSHGEDLLFYMELAKSSGLYDYTEEIVLKYRNTPNSAMKNLEGLEKGYRAIENEIRHWPEVGASDLKIFRRKYRRAMFLAYLKNKDFIKALKQFR